jgi:CPA2 family monovalent cation:H+ antiporter-2
MNAVHFVLLLAVAGAGVTVGRRIGLPPIVAYVLTGIAVGPSGLAWVPHSEMIEHLAELGVALLLFGIGIELSLDHLGRDARRLLAAGSLQIAGSIAVAFSIARTAGWDAAAAGVVGMITALSSTAIVFRLYQERGTLGEPPARAAAGMLLLQDLALVPMILLIPVLARPADGMVLAALSALGQAAFALAVLLVVARFALPRLLEQVARAGVPELFSIASLVVAFGTALAAVRLGLSLPVGALLAGLALSGSPYAQQVFAELLPLRDVFVAVFFTSVGMLLAPGSLWETPGTLAMLLSGVVAKGLLIALLVGVLWRSAGIGLRVGLALMQVGELAFVVIAQALAAGALAAAEGQALLAIAVVTMVATPAVMHAGERLARLGGDRDAGPESVLAGRVLVIGFGETGQAVARVLKETGLRFEAVDADYARVATARAEGLPIRLGDATRRGVLAELGAASARVAMVSVSATTTTRRIVSLLRRMNSHVRIVVRARRVAEIADLEAQGADEVIPSEFETSIEILARVLSHLGVPRHVVRLQESVMRAEHYRALRGFGTNADALEKAARVIEAGVIETALVQDGSAIAGRTLGEARVREATGVNVISLVRGDRPIPAPGADTRLEAGDLVVLHGAHEAIDAALRLFDAPAASPGGEETSGGSRP